MSSSLNDLLQGQSSGSVLGAIANPHVANPLAALQAGQQAAQTTLDLRQKLATQAQGQAFQAAIDPATGQFDQAKYMQNLQRSPNAAIGVQQAAQQGQTLNIDTYKLQSTQLSKGADAIGSLIGSYPQGIPQDAANAAVDREVAAGWLPAATGTQIKGMFGADPRQNSVVATQIYYHNMNNQQQLERMYGTRPAVPTGGATVFPTVPAPGAGPTVSVPNTMTPAELDTPGAVKLQDTKKTLPDGTPNPNYGNIQPYTRREVLTGQGYTFGPNNEVIPPGYTLGPDGKLTQSAPSTGGPSPLGSGRYPTVPPALRNAPAPAAPATPAPATAPVPAPAARPNITTSPTLRGPGAPAVPPPNQLQPNQPPANQPPAQQLLPPQVTQPQGPAQQPTQPSRPVTEVSPGEKATMEAAGPAFQREIDTGTKAQSQQALLGNMLADTKQFLPGAYAETMKNLRTRLSPIFGVNESALAAADSFDKIAAQLADAQGAGSDSRMAVNIAANPHSGMSASGVDLVIRQLQGNADYLQARQKLAQQWPAKSDYSGFTDSIRQLDPRVFQYERMTPTQATDWLRAMDPKDQRAFITAHKWAENKGLVPSRPGG